MKPAGEMYTSTEALEEIARANDWGFCEVCGRPFKLRTFIGEPGKRWYAGAHGVTIDGSEFCRGCVLSSYDYLRGDAMSWRGRTYTDWAEIVLRWATLGGLDITKTPFWESTWIQDEMKRRAR